MYYRMPREDRADRTEEKEIQDVTKTKRFTEESLFRLNWASHTYMNLQEILKYKAFLFQHE